MQVKEVMFTHMKTLADVHIDENHDLNMAITP